MKNQLKKMPLTEVAKLQEGDRVGISHRQSMWPFQYRFGASQTSSLTDSFRGRKDRGIHHAYTKLEE